MIGRLFSALSTGAASLAGVILVLMTVYTVVEIALRAAVGVSSNVLVEFVGYGLAAMTFLGAGRTMREGGMVRVGLLLHFTPPAVHRALDAFCLVCGIAAIGLGAWFVGADLWRSFTRDYQTDSVVPLPLWIPPLGLFAGMVAFLLDMAALLARVLAGKERLADESTEQL